MKRSGKGKKRKVIEGNDGYGNGNGNGNGDDGEDEGEVWMWASGKVGVWPSRSKVLVDGETIDTGHEVMTLT
jgi:hypothetical protein